MQATVFSADILAGAVTFIQIMADKVLDLHNEKDFLFVPGLGIIDYYKDEGHILLYGTKYSGEELRIEVRGFKKETRYKDGLYEDTTTNVSKEEFVDYIVKGGVRLLK